MIKLKNVSKYYYGKGVVTSGFTKVNIELKMGEFVVITGESGSGKSTLLNVISGVDSYEDGEMYINGEETSHYIEEDYENYRRKYIGNIFQNFNLVNSYTVYQNIELSVILNGESKRKVKEKVNKLIDIVGLTKWKNSKVSKLSGGQKQRVAIARALAKDTPIIIADEPTANLDSKSALSIMSLLNKISKDKLVVIVTHNYEQVEKYATRKIRMSDGKVLEDKKLIKTETPTTIKLANYKAITNYNKLRLGIRNTFNIKSKFIIVFLVFLFMNFTLLSNYATSQKNIYVSENLVSNNVFNDDITRIILKNQDNSEFNDLQIKEIKNIKNVKNILKNDYILEEIFELTNNKITFNTTLNSIDNFNFKLDKGRMPKKDNEIVIVLNHNNYFASRIDEILGEKFNSYKHALESEEYKVVGYKLEKEKVTTNMFLATTYLSNNALKEFENSILYNLSNKSIEINKNNISINDSSQFRVVPSKTQEKGTIILPDKFNYLCENNDCINEIINFKINNNYFNNSKEFKVTKIESIINKEENKDVELTYDKDVELTYDIYMNNEDFKELFNNGTYQISIFADSKDNVVNLRKQLTKAGYNALSIKESSPIEEVAPILNILKTVSLMFIIIFLFYISYFVIKITLKSRNIYYSTLRVLGATKSVANQLLIIELLTNATLAFTIILILSKTSYLINNNVWFVDTFRKMNDFLRVQDYALIYITTVLLTFVISQRFAKSLFKNSALKTMKEEV